MNEQRPSNNERFETRARKADWWDMRLRLKANLEQQQRSATEVAGIMDITSMGKDYELPRES